MEVDFKCPSCGVTITADTELSGGLHQCPKCRETIMVPKAEIGGPGTRIGGFRVLKRIGTGGMGDVYLADQTSMGRSVALKVLPPALTRDRKFLDLFTREIRTQGSLSHPNIATAYDAGSDGDIHYLAMEYVKGKDLGSILRERAPLSETEALSIARQVAVGMSAAWKKAGLIHRDIKPENIMVNEDGEVKILDLGVSKSIANFAGQTSRTRFIVGTPQYMSPEQARGGEEAGLQADIYSLGATVYHALTGVPPFQGANLAEVVTRQATEAALSPKKKNPDISNYAVHLLDVMMARDPQKRYETWEALILDIDRVLAEQRPLAALPGKNESMLSASPKVVVRSSKKQVVSGNGKPGSAQAAGTTRPFPLRPAVWLTLVLLAVIGAGSLWLAGRASRREQPVSPSRAAVPPAPAVDASQPLVPVQEVVEVSADAERRGRIDAMYWLALEELAEAPDDYERQLRSFEKIAAAAGAAGYTQYVQRATSETEKIVARRAEAVRQVVDGLIAEADERVRREQFAEAGEVFSAYQGPLEQASRGQRERLAAQYREKGKVMRVRSEADRELAQSAYQKLVEQVADATLTDAPAQAALGLVAQALEDPVFDPVEGKVQELYVYVKEVFGRDRAVLASFEEQEGEELEVVFESGPQTLLIKGVSSNEVAAMRIVETGTIGMTFSINDLSVSEQLNRISEVENGRRAFMVGLMALYRNRDEIAADWFAQSDHLLGDVLREKLAMRSRERSESAELTASVRQESEAVYAYENLARMLGLSGTPRNPEKRIGQLLATTYTDEQKQQAALSAALLLENYPESAVVRANRPLLLVASRLRDVRRVTAEGLHAALEEANPAYNGSGQFEFVEGQVVGVDLLDAGMISNITPLDGLPLTSLKLAGADLLDISPIRGMPLRTLFIHYAPVGDLSVLEAMPLEVLSLTGCKNVYDIGVLEGMALRELYLGDTPVSNLGVTKTMPLEKLEVGLNVRNIAVLGGLPLKHLSLSGSRIRTINALGGLPLESLFIVNTQIRDVTLLEPTPLRAIRFDPVRVNTGLGVLRRMKTLKKIAPDLDSPYVPAEEFWARYDRGEFTN